MTQADWEGWDGTLPNSPAHKRRTAKPPWSTSIGNAKFNTHNIDIDNANE